MDKKKLKAMLKIFSNLSIAYPQTKNTLKIA